MAVAVPRAKPRPGIRRDDRGHRPVRGDALAALGLPHPLSTLCAITATANHWVLDAIGGATVGAAGFALVHVLAGPCRVRLPGPPPPRAAPRPGTALPAGRAGKVTPG
ncbi:phosphatase PAP2 family protein [Streptomyces sp. NBC_01431]|uniref:phosphatase PAP2 family protein n=1 Tax=Streptomyces sp. NBC_01431 TaxID=2903863 RepID=UPI003FCE91F6